MKTIRHLLKNMFSFLRTQIFAVVRLIPVRQLKAEKICFSEICPRNITLCYDGNLHFNSYVELVNLGGRKCNLGGYGLSDSDEVKFIFEDETIIKAGRTLLIWAEKDGTERCNGELYTGFSISSGETIRLFNRDGKVIDELTIPEMEADRVYQLSPKAGSWCISRGSPREPFSTVCLLPDDAVNPPAFSIESGFYENEQTLIMQAPEDCTVYYTTDGTKPSTESNKYKKPIKIRDRSGGRNIYASIDSISTVAGLTEAKHRVKKGTVVRAISCNREGKISRETTATYFIGNFERAYRTLPTVSLIMNPEDLFHYERGIYVTGKVKDVCKESEADRGNPYKVIANYNQEKTQWKKGKHWKRSALVHYLDEEGVFRDNQKVTVSIYGGWSTALNQKSFNLLGIGEGYISNLFGAGSKSLILRSGGFRDTYATKIRDLLNQSLVKDRAFKTQDGKLCQLFLNGEYWGVYCLQERIDSSFIANSYNVDEENVIILFSSTVVAGRDEDLQLYEEIVSFAETKDLSVEENYRWIESKIDIQSYVDYQAFEIYIANADSVTNNFALWRTRCAEGEEYSDGRWRWIAYDTDDSAAMVTKLTDAKVDSFSSGHWHGTPMTDTLFSALTQNDEFCSRFASSLMEIAKRNFDYQRVCNAIDRFVEISRESVIQSQLRFRGSYVIPQYFEYDYMRDYKGKYCDEMYDRDIEILKNFFKIRNQIFHYDGIMNKLKNREVSC